MTNSQISSALSELGTLLELQGESGFRAQAYHMAARAVDQLPDELSDRGDDLGAIPGVGAAIHDKVVTLLKTGSLPQLEKVRAEVPAGLIRMLRVPGLGPKKVRALGEAGIGDLTELEMACDCGQVAKIKGFGAKTQANILTGLAFLASAGNRIRIDVADEWAAGELQLLRDVPGVTRVEICGSLRRRAETIGSLDFLIVTEDAAAVAKSLANTKAVASVAACNERLLSLRYIRDPNFRQDYRFVRESEFACAWHYFTGSKAHNTAVKEWAQVRGKKLTENALDGPTIKSEAQLFQQLGLTYIAPELREHTGEIEAAAQGRLPKLIEVRDIRGVFHNHTTASDGANTLEQMVEAAQALGHEYLGIADHSQSLIIARGLTPDRVRAQRREIDALNATLPDFRVFHGTECDILPGGELDFDDDLLAEFDYVVASVHTHFNLPREEMTARVIKAIQHPRVTMLGHATGRLLLRRDAFAVDLDAVLEAAADVGVMIEINAQPSRLDLDWVHARKAKEMGIPIVINPDAHSTGELALFKYGVDVARRAWLEKGDVFNTGEIDEVTEALEGRRG